jgi:hypothetical protein
MCRDLEDWRDSELREGCRDGMLLVEPHIKGSIAISVALFPTGGGGWQSKAHFTFAALLFLVLAYFSLFHFAKSEGAVTSEKRVRNRVYNICGSLMLFCIVLIGLFQWGLLGTGIGAIKPVFWLETFALWAFGVSWFVKGETLWRDRAA